MNNIVLLRELARIFGRAKDCVDRNGRKHSDKSGRFTPDGGAKKDIGKVKRPKARKPRK
jgi:hypothetical protein